MVTGMTLAIYCAGGLGKEVIGLARCVSRWDNIIFVDDVTEAEYHAGARVYRFEQIREYQDDVEFIIASGEPAGREKLYHRIKEAGYPLTTICDPGCSIGLGAEVKEGCVLYNSAISPDVVIEPNVFLDGRVVIGHDAVVGAHSVLSVNSFIGGHTVIGSRNYIGTGAILKDRIRTGEDTIVCMGSVLFRNARESSIMMGNPAKRIGSNKEKKVFGIFD